MHNEKKHIQKGQALIALIFITIIGVTLAAGATIIVAINLQSATKLQQGTVAYDIAESGAENALIKFLRNQSYTGETNFAVGSGHADITVTSSGGNNYVILSKGVYGNFVRQVQVNATYSNNTLNVTSRSEVY